MGEVMWACGHVISATIDESLPLNHSQPRAQESAMVNLMTAVWIHVDPVEFHQSVDHGSVVQPAARGSTNQSARLSHVLQSSLDDHQNQRIVVTVTHRTWSRFV